MNVLEKSNFFALDFEASSLNLAISYPIEVGYTNGTTIFRSFLILPDDEWFDWDPISQDIHKISREQLFKEGAPRRLVIKELEKDLTGQKVYCDGGIYDHHWLATLYDGIKRPSFKLLNSPVGSNGPHRALEDAKLLWHSINNLTDFEP